MRKYELFIVIFKYIDNFCDKFKKNIILIKNYFKHAKKFKYLNKLN